MAYSKTHPCCQSVLPDGSLCGSPAHIMSHTKAGPSYRQVNGYWICSAHFKKLTRANTCHYTNHKKNYCENKDGRLGPICTSTVVHDCQLSVDHIDGDHNNDDPSNLQTLCHNCHALKSRQDTLKRSSNGNTGNRDGKEYYKFPSVFEQLFAHKYNS